ncbi:MAG: hypothetical protein IJT51_08250 [Bacteroidales bacterium]|nr:hypothetical protein [Bacteroidales bacterium]
MKQIFLAVFFVCAAVLCGHAQPGSEKQALEEFKRQQAEFQQKMNDDFAQFSKQRDSLNRAFAKQLQQAWEEFEAHQGIERPNKPTPKVQPQYNIAPSTNTFKEIKVQKVIEDNASEMILEKTQQKKTVQENSMSPDELSMSEFKQEKIEGKTVTADFFGYYLDMFYDNDFAISMRDNSEGSVSMAWQWLSGTQYMKLVNQLQQLETQLHLNDWALFQLIANTSDKIFSKNRVNEKRIFQIFIYSQLGYAAKIGRLGNEIIILIPFKTDVYKLPYYTFKNTKYYLMGCNGNKPQKFYSYSFDLGTNRAKCDLDIKNPIWLPQNNVTKTYGKNVLPKEISVLCNKNALDFYSTMPMSDLGTYTSSEIDELVSTKLMNALRPFVAGKSEKDAAALLLSFVQKSFVYATDEEQFGYEKYFFPDELLYYNNSDCEDRSILFAYLVRKLLNLNVVLLDYPDHVATAVRFNENVTGDYVKYKGKNYIICDPTYIGAPVGEAMPEYKDVAATVIPKH